jgi:hypothetical protein
MHFQKTCSTVGSIKLKERSLQTNQLKKKTQRRTRRKKRRKKRRRKRRRKKLSQLLMMTCSEMIQLKQPQLRLKK